MGFFSAKGSRALLCGVGEIVGGQVDTQCDASRLRTEGVQADDYLLTRCTLSAASELDGIKLAGGGSFGIHRALPLLEELAGQGKWHLAVIVSCAFDSKVGRFSRR